MFSEKSHFWSQNVLLSRQDSQANVIFEEEGLNGGGEGGEG